jgi:hypothetical protein
MAEVMAAWLLAAALGGATASAEVELHGFAEFAAASRLAEDEAIERDLVLEEARAQLQLAAWGERAEARVRLDFLHDGVFDEALLEVREAVVSATLSDAVELKAGRQILTWGTGDLLFVNDQFPKDYVSFFSGRDDEYLKAPSDALKLSVFLGGTTLDLVWLPSFEPDVFLSGRRLSIGLPPGAVLAPREPEADLGESELAARAARTFGSTEAALYAYLGRHGQPVGLEEGVPVFPRLVNLGASVRRPLAGGIVWAEGAWADTEAPDAEGNAPPDAFRGFAGWERELARDLTAAVQAFVELPEAGPSRTLLTLRLTRLARQQTVRLSLFGFLSPDDGDGHLRPSVRYDFTDDLAITAGANLLWGDDGTELGRLEDNTNVYARVRYSF